MTTSEIRKQFLDFFKDRNHAIVPSAPVVNKNDPSLMFINAGMNQFKDRFLGNQKEGDKRVADTQKCLRVSGKHNDLEEVGVDTYHHTLFEMLGNWSFGDYFKETAINQAWEFLTQVLNLKPENLYVTYFEGDEELGLEPDEETKSLWKKYVPEERILTGNKKDNFWEMGEVGPCGPCTEIHVDVRSDEEKAKVSGRDLVNQDHPQVIEVWNLVFIQFNRKKDGSLENLPEKHVDTGMGLERLAMVLQGKSSTYDTDLFQTLIIEIEKYSGKKYQGGTSKVDVAFRVLSDHIRAVAFAIADGQLPSNGGAGYVIRRILRRAIRYAYSFLDLNEPFFHKLALKLNELMGDHFEELSAQIGLIEKVILEEEQAFFRTLANGIALLDEELKTGAKELSGAKAFELYDTFGFPIDLTQLITSENGVSIDMLGFEAELKQQKERSRADGKLDVEDWIEVKAGDMPVFVGYDNLESNCELLKYRKVNDKKGELYQVVVNQTPFYPEGGGQVGDKGYFLQKDGSKLFVTDTKKENDLIIHWVKEEPKEIVSAHVNVATRQNSARNHTATHLLHHVLREQLGTHVEQKGSLVSPDVLRFDFSHFSALTVEEIESIEKTVNELILSNINLDEHREISIDEAKAKGAMALFGEKYGDKVRMIQFGDSKELCGGTHVKSTGAIGLFRIKSESSIASGVRRIEAISAQKAIDFSKEKEQKLLAIADIVKNSNATVKAVESLVEQNKKLQQELDAFKKQQAQQEAGNLLNNKKELANGVSFIGSEVSLAPDVIKDLCFGWRKSEKSLIAVLGGDNNGKANLNVFVSDDLVKEKSQKAGDLVKAVAKLIQGGGGGAPFFASAGGKNPSGIPAAIKEIEEIVSKI